MTTQLGMDLAGPRPRIDVPMARLTDAIGAGYAWLAADPADERRQLMADEIAAILPSRRGQAYLCALSELRKTALRQWPPA